MDCGTRRWLRRREGKGYKRDQWHVQSERSIKLMAYLKSQCREFEKNQSDSSQIPVAEWALIIFLVIWLQILAWLAEIHWKTCLPSFSHKLFRAAKFLAYIYSPNSGFWATKFTSKWLMMKLNCWKWFVWQQQCPWPLWRASLDKIKFLLFVKKKFHLYRFFKRFAINIMFDAILF